MDRAFLQKLRRIVEKNLEDENFGVQDLAHEVGMSRSQIHRKLRELSNQSTTQFIREIRLEHAMELLRDQVGTVSEIAYRVGFSSPTYFSKCFHEYYGFPPGEAIHKGTEEISTELTSKDGTDLPESQKKNHNSIFWTSALFLLLLIISGYYYYQNGYNQNSGGSISESIAVLPLNNLPGDSEQEFFLAGLHDALVGEPGQLRNLRVISRTSTLQYRDAELNMQEIAEELGVKNIIEGSVYRAGDSVRIQIQLIQVDPMEKHIWAQKYERDTRDILFLLSDVTREIAQNVQVTLTPVEDSLLADRREVNPEAYKAYLRGQYLLNTTYTQEGYERGIGYLMEAVRIDPADPLPWARLALGYNTAGHGISPPPDAFQKAQAAAEKALKLDETLGEVHLALALVDLYQTWDWEAATNSFNQALKYDPNIAEAHAHNSWFAMLKGEGMEKAIEEQKLAMELDPFMPLYPTYLSFIYWYAGEEEKAIEAAKESLRLDPEFAYGYYVLGAAYSAINQFNDAIGAHEKASNLNSDWKFALAVTYARAGREAEARQIAEELLVDPKPIDTWGLAEIYTALGDTDKAFKWLDACYKVRWSWYPWMYWHPHFDPLQNDPRFQDHLDRARLPNPPSMASDFQ
jgi:TolB-like protein/AraC-like DNA-binding protein/Tfp pilus assembly protein PilF